MVAGIGDRANVLLDGKIRSLLLMLPTMCRGDTIDSPGHFINLAAALRKYDNPLSVLFALHEQNELCVPGGACHCCASLCGIDIHGAISICEVALVRLLPCHKGGSDWRLTQ
ncbi:Hypothetical predicted protein [Podarcis lilfordi]|uniref:Uncharacterized protein n=1 Tax=Podarcis lilfordi TaxID=74358 RepID=A0AA35JNE5_9SAUR|nr:Hypothetical predicted protein [Podarcis lilfordi]